MIMKCGDRAAKILDDILVKHCEFLECKMNHDNDCPFGHRKTMEEACEQFDDYIVKLQNRLSGLC